MASISFKWWFLLENLTRKCL